jgi:hypothetical protein
LFGGYRDGCRLRLDGRSRRGLGWAQPAVRPRLSAWVGVATTIAHAPTFRHGSRSKSRAISRSRTSEPRYRPRRRIAPAVRRLEMTSARVRIPGLSVGVLPSSLRLCRPRSPPIPSRRAPRTTCGVMLGKPRGPVTHAASYTARGFRSTSSTAKRRENVFPPPTRVARRTAEKTRGRCAAGRSSSLRVRGLSWWP